MATRQDVSILMTTYNSERFLVVLLESIINQSYLNWKLFIRDDGSTDNTIKIIKNYSKKDKRIIIMTDKTIHRGPKDGFIWLMSQVDSDYYMFCDHDDVWLPNKIELTLNKILTFKEENKNKPIIIHTDLIVVNENLEVLHPSFWRFSHTSPRESNSYRYHCAYNNITGCTMLFNRIARTLSLNAPQEAYMHDSWVALVVSFHNGIISYISDCTILYRQHHNNTLGAKKIPSVFSQLSRINKIIDSNLNQYKTICKLQRISFLYFFLNKLYFNLKLRLRMVFNILRKPTLL